MVKDVLVCTASCDSCATESSLPYGKMLTPPVAAGGFTAAVGRGVTTE